MPDDTTRRQSNAVFLDNLEQADRLRKWHAFCAQMPFADGPTGDAAGSTWADVIFGPDETDIRDVDAAARIRRRIDDLCRRAENPDGEMPPLQALLLVFLHWMETPTRLYNGLMARHRDLYYRGELGLSERGLELDGPEAGAMEAHAPGMAGTDDKPGAASPFFRRAAHRLHHRNRILTAADMQAFVQDTFPLVRAMKLVKDEKRPRTYRLVVVRASEKSSAADDGVAGEQAQDANKALLSIEQTIRRHCSPWLVISVEEAEPLPRGVSVVIRRARANRTAARDSGNRGAQNGTPPGESAGAIDKAIARDVETRYGRWTVAQDGRTLLLGQALDRYRLVELLLGNSHVDELVSLSVDDGAAPAEHQYVVPRVTVSEHRPVTGDKDA
ncbi:MAG: hypothetical protein ACRYHA_11925 [Janthinobacterium lividum]